MAPTDTTMEDIAKEEERLKAEAEFRQVPIGEIRENPVALRTVNRQSEAYMGIVESMREKGFLGSLTGRKQIDPESGEGYIEIIDGLHRYNAAKDAGIAVIPMHIVDLNKDQVLEAQIMLNIHKIETKPSEYSAQLKRLLNRKPLLTVNELGSSVGKSGQWVKERLTLNKIVDDGISKLIDDGKICLTNAYALAKLPPDEMGDWVDRAMTENPATFSPAVNKRKKEINEAKRTGADAKPQEFQPVAHAQKVTAVKDEMEAGVVAKALCKGLKSAEDGFMMAVKWMLHLDPQSLKVQKAQYDERMALKAEKKKKRDAEKAAKKAEKEKKEAAVAAEASVKAIENAKASAKASAKAKAK